ncbi:hypothetical protein [Flavobacterium sp. KACC 22761]|uniref:hypothetical protein n=1 Tax=Flavobacterium sp. KACC 22761 TaxID=3092665 RepID=UPI002A762D27|nr:hypothetical protein [Flavobacterium sp. KACC 22761]WPO77059.1 hypothetical protein SCB73_12390 [Flavobacterium sp. KACC 22761]
MKQLLFIILFFLSLNAKSQTSIQGQIIGNWKVEKVIVPSNSKEMTELSQAFTNSIFSFQKNQDFNFIPKQKTQLTSMFVQMLQNQKWIFDEKRKLIRIGTTKDRYSIMGITPKIEKNNAYFKLEEGEISLELIKI